MEKNISNKVIKGCNVNVQGKVKWFNTTKGYGFISGSDGQDVFVHYSSIIGDGYKNLAENDMVEYEVVTSEKGPKAQNVRKI